MSNSQRSAGIVCGWVDCGMKFGALKNLVKHLSEEHVGFKKENYYCGWVDCPRSQNAQNSRFALISHLRSHTGEKPYICIAPSCSREFTRSDSLNKHIRTTHPELVLPKAESQYGSSQPDSDQGYGDDYADNYEENRRSSSRKPQRREASNQALYEPSPPASQRYVASSNNRSSKPQQLSRQVFESSRDPIKIKLGNPAEANLNSQQKYSLLKAKLLFVKDEREAYLEQLKMKKEKVRLLLVEKHLLLSTLMSKKARLEKQAVKRQEKRDKRKQTKLLALDGKKSKKKLNFPPRRRRVVAKLDSLNA